MTTATWVSLGTALATLIVLGAVVFDRRRMQQRLASAEGRIAGLQLDRDALAERVSELAAYLSRPASWDVDDTPPAHLTDPAPVDRWTPATRPVAPPSAPSPQAASPLDVAHRVTPPQRQSR